MKTILALIPLFSAVTALAVQVMEVKVKTLDGFGGDVGAVKSRCQTKVGETYDPVMLTRDVSTLKDTGEFEDISADANDVPGGVSVVFYIKRKIRFSGPLVVQGNSALSESKIAKEAELKDGTLYGESELAVSAERVRRAYLKKSYPDAKVIPRFDLISGNDATVTFVIDEGARRKIDGFSFLDAPHLVTVGALRKSMPAYELEENLIDESEVREAIGDYPWWNPIGWFTDSPVSRDQLAQCCAKIEAVYRAHGYLDARVTGPEYVGGEDGRATVAYRVSEGPQYRIGTCRIAGVKTYPVETVVEKSKLPAASAVAGEKALEEAAHRIKVVVGSGDSGLADTRVVVKTIPSVANPEVVDIVFQVTEGVPVVIDEIQIRGNDFTKDNVIRREILLSPGDRMLEDRAEKSKHRLEALDYFSRVNYSLEPSDRGKAANGSEYRNLVYEVEEKGTGTFMVGVGASSVDSIYVTAEVNQYNFDLFAPTKLFRGAGQKGRLYAAWGPRYQSVEAGIVEPYFCGRMLELSVDAYRRLRWYDEYDLIRSGAQASLSYPVKFWPTWKAFGRLGLGLSGEFIEFDDVDHGEYTRGDPDDEDKYVSFKEEERKYGDAFEPVLHFFWTKDERDRFKIPTRGYRTRLFLDLAPGGDNQYWRLGINQRNYFSVWKRYGHVFMAALRAETIDAFSDDVAIYNRMFLGGPRSIRGIEYRNVAPMVRKVTDSEHGSYAPWGGQSLFCMNFEYTVPIVKMFRVAAFSDLGSVSEDVFDLDFSDTFAWTAGLGLRLDLPMFPIRLDFAIPIEKPSHADKELFSFLVGYDF